MSIKEWIENAEKEGKAQMFVIYANIGNNANELVACESNEADAHNCEIVDVYYIEHSENLRTAVIIAEVK